MKTPSKSLYRSLLAAGLAAPFVLSSLLHAQSWDGGGTTTGWGNADNWDPNGVPTFGNTTNLIFNNLTRPSNFIGANRIVRSLSYGADIDALFETGYLDFNGGAARNLTMQADTGNAFITVDSGATGNINLGYTTGGSGTAGAMILASNLDIIHNGTGVLTFNRAIQGIGFGITKSGTGTMALASIGAAPNTFTGDININAGKLIANGFVVATDINNAAKVNLGGGILEISSVSGANKDYNLVGVEVNSASTIAYRNLAATNYSLTFSGTAAFLLNANLTLQNTSITTTNQNPFIISRSITGAGNLTVDTYNNITSSTSNFLLGRVTLSGANAAWTGDLIIKQGTAQIAGDSTLSQFNAGSGDIILGETSSSSGAGLLLAATAGGGAKTLDNDIVVRSGGFRTIRGGSDHTYFFGGNVTLEGDLNIHNGLFFNDKNMIFTGNISGLGGLSITESGNPGFTRLTGNNTYSGATTIGADAVLNILSASGNAIGDSSAVIFAGAGATLTFNSTNETVGSIASGGTDGNINLGANTLTTGGNNQSTSFGGVIAGSGSLVKTGAGTMTLTGSNSYTGTTLIDQGTIVLGASASLASASVQVATNGVFDVSGSGFTVASGNRLGGDGLITGNVTFASGANFIFNATATLNVSGTVAFDNSFGVANLVNADGSAVDWSIVSTGIYTLIDGTVSDFSNISNFGIGNAFDIGGGNVAYFQNGSLELVVAAIPEPGTFGLLGGIAALGFVGMRRRRAN